MNRWNVTLFLVSAALALGLPVAAMAAADLTIQLSRVGAGPVFTGNQDQVLFSDRWLCAVDAKNPHVRNNRLTMKQYLQLPHLVYSIETDRQLNHWPRHIRNRGGE